MDNKRAKTLEALSVFVQAQKSLLARTQADLERLKGLKNDSLSRPDAFLADLNHELHDAVFKLSEQLDARVSPPETIDWSLFASHDPGPLTTLAASSRALYAQRNEPHTVQRSELSQLQLLVKNARRTIVDPVLEQFSSESQDQSDVESEPELKPLARTRRGQHNSRTCGLTLPFCVPDVGDICIRHDLEDESREVDIFHESDPWEDVPKGALYEAHQHIMEANISSCPETRSTSPACVPLNKSTRVRRPTVKHKAAATTVTRTAKSSPRKVDLEPQQDQTSNLIPERPPGRVRRSKSETYKMAWSLSEQHLLERLLKEIPEGERQRWLKISRAMNGRRTPKQVASRVQKYFEKLRQFGLKVDGAGTSADVG